MTKRNLTGSFMELRNSSLRTLIAAVLVLIGTTGDVVAQAHLTNPAKQDDGLARSFDNVSLLSILDDLAKRTGMVIEGRHLVTDRQISGRYEGHELEVLKRLLRGERYMLLLGASDDQGNATAETIIFLRRSKWKLPDNIEIVDRGPGNPNPNSNPIDNLGVADAPAVNKSNMPNFEPRVSEASEIHPVPPAIGGRLRQAISPPPSGTPERHRFDAAVAEVRNELERTLRPLRNLR